MDRITRHLGWDVYVLLAALGIVASLVALIVANPSQFADFFQYLSPSCH